MARWAWTVAVLAITVFLLTSVGCAVRMSCTVCELRASTISDLETLSLLRRFGITPPQLSFLSGRGPEELRVVEFSRRMRL